MVCHPSNQEVSLHSAWLFQRVILNSALLVEVQPRLKNNDMLRHPPMNMMKASIRPVPQAPRSSATTVNQTPSKHPHD